MGKTVYWVFVEGKALMFPRNGKNTNLYLVQKILWDFKIQTEHRGPDMIL